MNAFASVSRYSSIAETITKCQYINLLTVDTVLGTSGGVMINKPD